MSWYTPLEAIPSKGSRTTNVGGLAGIADARREHQGQFFTPTSVVRWIWNLVSDPIAVTAMLGHRKVNLLDTSIGSGRLIQFADPSTTRIVGCDVDRPLIASLREALSKAGFTHDLSSKGMEIQRGRGRADLAIINPPFSLHLDRPEVEPFPSGTRGAHHLRSSTISHLHAVHQACAWSDLVIAILPTSAIAALRDKPPTLPLHAIHHLPATAFREEGADVQASILVFRKTKEDRPVVETTITDLNELPTPYPISNLGGSGHFDLLLADHRDGPAITIPVTGNPAIRVYRHGRHLRLTFACGLNQARVLNHLMRSLITYDPEDATRRHPGITYRGQGWQDLENFLAQPDPFQAFEDFLASMRKVGGAPKPDRQLLDYLRCRVKRHRRASAPFGQCVFDMTAGIDSTVAFTLTGPLPVTKRFGGPVLRPGTPAMAERTDTGFRIVADGHTVDVDEERFASLSGRSVLGSPEWRTVRQPLMAYFPDLSRHLEHRLRALGIDRFLTRDYQFEDFLELVVKGTSAGVAWDMGLGKARLALALALYSGGRAVIVVQAHLVDELRKEIATTGMLTGVPWQVITSPAQAREPLRINIIAYSRLRMPIHQVSVMPDEDITEESGCDDQGDDTDPSPAVKIPTYADLLARHRPKTVICDEAHLLCNPHSQQSRAVQRLGGRRRYALTGTPVANYVRDLLPLLIWVGGDATARQPYGYRNPYLEPKNLTDLNRNRRSVDVFRERFVTLKWVTNEFKDDLCSGAKREIPHLRNPGLFHLLLAPLFKRRRIEEPQVAKHIKIPKVTYRTSPIAWDQAHLLHYLTVGEDFLHWFRNHAEDDKQRNLVAILARIDAVVNAANAPDLPGPYAPAYLPATSKHQALFERLADNTAKGHRTIVYVHRPGTAERLAGMAQAQGVQAMTYHGRMPVAKRNRALYRDFVDGQVPNLIATIGSCQTGLNLHAADRVIFYERSWTGRAVSQAAARVLRPQQERPVLIEFLELEGSIDRYQGQLVASKNGAARLALDYELPDDATEEFLHLDTILAHFVDDLAAVLGVGRQDVRRTLAALHHQNRTLSHAL